MFDQLHLNHLKQIAFLAKTKGDVYVHGDGNLYTDTVVNGRTKTALESSDRRLERASYSLEDAQFRVLITKNNVPKTIEDLIDMFYAAKQKEDKAKGANASLNKTDIFEMPKDEDEEIKTDEPKVDSPELAELKLRADTLGIDYSDKIGVSGLTKKIIEFEADQKEFDDLKLEAIGLEIEFPETTTKPELIDLIEAAKKTE